MTKDVYLDHAATSWPKPPGVLGAIVDFFGNAGGNMGRAGHHRSIASSRVVSLARESLADLLGAGSPDDIIFTKNATEALNLAINGLAADGARIVTSSLEHNSVMRPLRYLESAGRASVEVVPTDGNTGALDLDAWSAALRGTARCLAIATHASNVTGVVLPIAAMAAAAREAGVAMIVDASQSAGHMPFSLPELGATAVAMPGHKGLLGPMGTGLLYLAPDVEMEPLIRGGTGSQSELETQPDFAPDRYESGTLNGPGIVGLGAAAEYLQGVGIAEVHARSSALGARFREALAGVEGIVLYGPDDPAARHRDPLGQHRGLPVRDRRTAARRRMGRDDARRPPLRPRRPPLARYRARRDTSPLMGLRHDRGADRGRRRGAAHDRGSHPRGRAREDRRMRWGGVISFYASEHAMRGERVLERAGVPARLVPGPREVSPNCGVAVAFRWDDEPEVERALQESRVRYEAIHRYELDDESGAPGVVTEGDAVKEAAL